MISKVLKLKNKYEDACNEYLELFCEKQEMTNDGWVADDVGGIAVCSDFYFNLHDIVLDINTNQPKGDIVDWYYDNIDADSDYINYNSYIMGLRIKDVNNEK